MHKRFFAPFNKIKLTVLLLALALFLSACGALPYNGNATDTSAETTAAETLSPPAPAVNSLFGVGYCKNENGVLNPITTYANLNTALFSLLYDGLFCLDESFSPQNVLCESISWDGAAVTVKLKSGVVFHDGSALTSADIIYSLDMAKNNEKSVFQKRLSVIKEFAAADNHTVILTLTSQRNSISSLLTFPVIKKGTGVSTDAVGCGRYKIMESEDVLYLVPNTAHHGGMGEAAPLEYILLTEIKNNDVLEYGVLSGNIDILKVNMLPANGVFIYSNSDKVPVDTSSFVFIGFNTNYGSLKQRNLRRALALIIDAAALREEVFGGHIKKAAGLYPRSLYPNAAFPAENTPDIETAGSLVSSLGYSLSDGKYTDINGQALVIKIAVGKNEFLGAAAQRISEMLAAAGIGADISVLSESALQNRLKTANFDMYISEVNVAPDFDFTFLLGSGGTANYGGFFESVTNTNIANFALFGVAQSENTAVLISESVSEYVPIIPIGYRVDYVCINREYKIGGVRATAGDPFYNIFEWKVK